MVDVFRTDPHRLGTIIILGDSMLLVLTSDGAQLQLQGHGLGKHLLWHCASRNPEFASNILTRKN